MPSVTKREPICLRWSDGFHSGAEVRLAAAVAHLVDLWNMADELHSRAVIAALRALLASPIGCTHTHAIRDMMSDQLGYDGMVKLFGQLQSDDCGCPAGTHEEINRLIDAYDDETKRTKGRELRSEDYCVSCGERGVICCDSGDGKPVCAYCCDKSLHETET